MSGFTELTRAKILAETGPLEQFPHWRALLAYAGLKVRMRSSGKYRGQDKIDQRQYKFPFDDNYFSRRLPH